MRMRVIGGLALVISAVAIGQLAWGQRQAEPVRRAELPTFDDNAARDVFFDDVFSRLQGERPTQLTVTPGPAGEPGAPADSAEPADAPAAEGSPWAALISPVTIEDEVKAINIELDQVITTPGRFAGGDFRAARREFSMLAMMFAIIEKYDDQVRWKRDAAIARDSFARVAANTRVGSQQAYNEARLRKEDLANLVRGGRLEQRPVESELDWSQVVDRSPLMQRLETSMSRRLRPWTANADVFRQHPEELLHEAEIIAAIGEVLLDENMPYSDYDEYQVFAREMRDAAREIVDAVHLDQYEQARQAVGAIDLSCSDCHEFYRG